MAGIPKKHIHVLILCGGGGKRLWPKSTLSNPKQFTKLLGEKTLFQQTVDRAKLITDWKNIWIITHKNYVKEIKSEAPQLLEQNIIAEPMTKNTAMAHLVGAFFIRKRDPKGLIVNMYGDPLIENVRGFKKTIDRAVKIAADGEHLVDVGVRPTFPSTSFGYIKKGKLLSGTKDMWIVDGFSEKPDFKTAKKFLKTGEYLWNISFYTWHVEIIINEARKLAPDICSLAEKASRAKSFKEMKKIYDRVESSPVDKTISEKTNRMLVVSAEFDWDDLGSWQSVYDHLVKDKDKNVVFSDKAKRQVLIDCRNLLIHATGKNEKAIGVIGADNLFIVETDRALLICKKSDHQKVKELVERMMLGDLKKFC